MALMPHGRRWDVPYRDQHRESRKSNSKRSLICPFVHERRAFKHCSFNASNRWEGLCPASAETDEEMEVIKITQTLSAEVRRTFYQMRDSVQLVVDAFITSFRYLRGIWSSFSWQHQHGQSIPYSYRLYGNKSFVQRLYCLESNITYVISYAVGTCKNLHQPDVTLAQNIVLASSIHRKNRTAFLFCFCFFCEIFLT